MVDILARIPKERKCEAIGIIKGFALCAEKEEYTSKGWYVGKTKMKDWKASVRTWEKNQRQKNKKSKDDEGLEGWLNA